MSEFNPRTPGALKASFEVSRLEVTGETLEQIRQNYYIAAKMSGSDDNSIGGLNINKSGRSNSSSIAKQKENKATGDMLFIAMLDRQLEALEDAMIAKYGEDFAENLAAEYLDEDTYKKLMEIEDPEERRKAIAKAINDGIRSGTIDPSEIDKNPDFKEWLDKHADLSQKEFEHSLHQASSTEKNLDVQNSATNENSGLENQLNSLFT